MRASSFRYLVKNGIKNLWNNRMMTVASVGTLIACLLIVGFAVLFSINVDNIVKFVGEQNEIVVFVDLDAPEGVQPIRCSPSYPRWRAWAISPMFPKTRPWTTSSTNIWTATWG